MSMSIILKSDVIARAPDRWAAQYATSASAEQREITSQLMALKGTPFTEEQVDAIIGNDSWTQLECSECGEDSPWLIRIGEEPDYETRWVDLCPHCLAAAVALASAQP